MAISARLKVTSACLALCVLIGYSAAHQKSAVATAATGRVPYSTVAPLIKANCESCHNAAVHPEKVDLSSYQALMHSGEHGPIVIAGHPEKSKLIMYVSGIKQPRMPFHKAPLSNSDISLLKHWIAAGAKS